MTNTKKFNRQNLFHGLDCILNEIDYISSEHNNPEKVKSNLTYLKHLITKYT